MEQEQRQLLHSFERFCVLTNGVAHFNKSQLVG